MISNYCRYFNSILTIVIVLLIKVQCYFSINKSIDSYMTWGMKLCFYWLYMVTAELTALTIYHSSCDLATDAAFTAHCMYNKYIHNAFLCDCDDSDVFPTTMASLFRLCRIQLMGLLVW